MSASFGSGRCSAAACGFSTTSELRSCRPSLRSTVTMFDWTIAGSLAQPRTLTVLAANGPPSCSASPRGTTNSANSMMTAICLRLAGGASRQRLQVERPQQVAVDELERRSRLAHERLRGRLAPERVLQPVAPVLAAPRRAHAAAAVVAQDDVVAGEHDLLEKGREREQLAAVRHDVEDVAVEEELRRRAGPEQVAHLVGPGGEVGVRTLVSGITGRSDVHGPPALFTMDHDGTMDTMNRRDRGQMSSPMV